MAAILMFRLLSTIFILCNLGQFTMAREWVESLSLTLVTRKEGRVGGGIVDG